jgi:hypothetical protein
MLLANFKDSFHKRIYLKMYYKFEVLFYGEMSNIILLLPRTSFAHKSTVF